MGWWLDLKMKKYFVYVIELDEKVNNNKKFWQKNPKYIRGNGCVYVGQSARKPEIRFEQHKEGYKANYFAKLYGIKLFPVPHEKYNPISTRKNAEENVFMLGKALRLKQFGVWFN